MSHKKLFILFLTASLFYTTHSVAATVFKIATLSPDGSSWMKRFRAGAQEITKLTDNRVKFKFYPGGVMGDDDAVLRKIRVRQLQGGAIAISALGQHDKDSMIYGLPMLFNSLEEVRYVRQQLDQEILAGLEKKGFVSFGLAGGGFAYIMSLSPIQNSSELSKSKVWVPSNDPMVMDSVDAYKVQPIPLPIGDVLTGLQTGLINTVGSPPVVTLALQWHTQVKYLTDMPLLYSTALMIIDKRSFKKLSATDQKIVRDMMGKVFMEIDKQNEVDNVEALVALKNQGITFVSPTPDELKEWRDLARQARENIVKSGGISQKMMNRLNKYLQEYRTTH